MMCSQPSPEVQPQEGNDQRTRRAGTHRTARSCVGGGVGADAAVAATLAARTADGLCSVGLSHDGMPSNGAW